MTLIDNQQKQYAASLDDVEAASKRLAGSAHVTPVMTCGTLDSLTGHRLHFKCEIFQKGGAFKFRGAYNSVQQLSPDQAAKGVVTHSSGNHAAALALAASMRGIPAYIVVPSNAPACKVAAVKEYGGHLLLCEPTMAAREGTCAKVAAETGATFIPPYDYGPVIAGQGTMGLELLQQVPDLDVIVVPVSGGGMLAGIAITAKAIKPNIIIIAAEPSGTNDAADVAAAKAAGHLITDLPKPFTIADGLQARLGQFTWPVVRDLVDGVVVISDREIIAAMKLVFERMKLVVEPSGAAGLAAVLSPAFANTIDACSGQKICAVDIVSAAPHGQQAANAGGKCDSSNNCGQRAQLNVGVILCGGNIDFDAKGFWQEDNWQPGH